MSAETPEDIDRSAIAEHAQRMAEQSALRKVRKTLDGIKEAETSERRSLRMVLALCAVLAVVGAWFFWGLLFGGSDAPKEAPMKIPGALQPKQ